MITREKKKNTPTRRAKVIERKLCVVSQGDFPSLSLSSTEIGINTSPDVRCFQHDLSLPVTGLRTVVRRITIGDEPPYN